MTTLSLKNAFLQAVRGGVLGLPDCRGRLEGDAEVDRGTVGNTTLDTARVVGLGGETPVGRDNEGVIVDRAGHLAAAEAGANLEALGGGDAQHSVGQLRLQLVEARLAQADGHVADDAGHGSANAVLCVAELLDHLGHACGGLGLGAANGSEAVHRWAVDGLQELQVLGVGRGGGVFGGWGEEVLVADRGDKGDNLDVVGELEVLLGDGASSDTT